MVNFHLLVDSMLGHVPVMNFCLQINSTTIVDSMFGHSKLAMY